MHICCSTLDDSFPRLAGGEKKIFKIERKRHQFYAKGYSREAIKKTSFSFRTLEF